MTNREIAIAELQRAIDELPKIKEIYAKGWAKSEITGVPNPGLDVVEDLIKALEDVKTASRGDIRSWLNWEKKE